MKKLYVCAWLCLAGFSVSAQIGSVSDAPNSSAVFNFVAVQDMQSVHLHFRSVNTLTAFSHDIERSSNGIDFLPIGSLSGDALTDNGEFMYTDATPLNGTNYYRIKTLSYNGTAIYSAVRKVETGKYRPDIFLTPNPVTTGNVNLQLQNLEDGNYSLEVYNSDGVRVYIKSIRQFGGQLSEQLRLPANIRSGLYMLMLKGKNYHYNKTIQVVK